MITSAKAEGDILLILPHTRVEKEPPPFANCSLLRGRRSTGLNQLPDSTVGAEECDLAALEQLCCNIPPPLWLAEGKPPVCTAPSAEAGGAGARSATPRNMAAGAEGAPVRGKAAGQRLAARAAPGVEPGSAARTTCFPGKAVLRNRGFTFGSAAAGRP